MIVYIAPCIACALLDYVHRDRVVAIGFREGGLNVSHCMLGKVSPRDQYSCNWRIELRMMCMSNAWEIPARPRCG